MTVEKFFEAALPVLADPREDPGRRLLGSAASTLPPHLVYCGPVCCNVPRQATMEMRKV
jgi:hypothetical protein